MLLPVSMLMSCFCTIAQARDAKPPHNLVMCITSLTARVMVKSRQDGSGRKKSTAAIAIKSTFFSVRVRFLFGTSATRLRIWKFCYSHLLLDANRFISSIKDRMEEEKSLKRKRENQHSPPKRSNICLEFYPLLPLFDGSIINHRWCVLQYLFVSRNTWINDIYRTIVSTLFIVNPISRSFQYLSTSHWR